MCERRNIKSNPDVSKIRQIVEAPRGVRDIHREQKITRMVYEINIGDHVARDEKKPKYEVGQIFGSAKKARYVYGVKSDANEWFRKNGGI